MKIRRLFYVSLYLIVVAINIFKCYKGAGFEDEYFYAIGGYRLFQGDALMFDEVNVAMFMSLFTYPFICVFMFVTKSTNCIVLYMRLCYVAFVVVTSLVFYFRYRQKGKGVFCATILYLLLTPFNIMALSYNTLGLGFVLLSICSIPKNIDKAKAINYILFGIFYSFAVLNSPLLAIVYFVAIILFLFVSRKIKVLIPFIKGSLVGVLISFLLVILFVFSRTSMTNIIKSLPLIVDGSHSYGLVWQFLASGKTILGYFGIFSLIAVFYLSYIVVYRNKIKHNIYIYIYI